MVDKGLEGFAAVAHIVRGQRVSNQRHYHLIWEHTRQLEHVSIPLFVIFDQIILYRSLCGRGALFFLGLFIHRAN